MSSKLISVDVEADGPCPGLYSMVCFGAVIVESNPDKKFRTFYGETAPISTTYITDALKVSGFNREQHLAFRDPSVVMPEFLSWLATEVTSQGHRPTFISDNPAFDWQFINYYLHRYTNTNPFGFSARRIGDLYCGATKHLGNNTQWKRQLRVTKHDHNPVNDAMGNAEALLSILGNFNLGGVVL